MPPRLEAAAALGLSCRPMTDEDLPFVARLYASTRAEEIARTEWPAHMQAAFLDQQHRSQHAHYRGAYPDGLWLILEREGAPVGRLYLDEREDDLHLIDISLLPEICGAGLGSAIIADLADHAGAGGKTLSLNVEAGSRAATLYARLGFKAEPGESAYKKMVLRP